MVMIYADGADYESMVDLNNNEVICGFTTNPTLMRQANVKNYEIFAKKVLAQIKFKPISFEVFADDFNEMHRQAIKITSWGQNVNVKIPITNTKGETSKDLIKDLTNQNVKCNVTAIFTKTQVKEVLEVIDKSSDLILSVFAGRIADTGVDPIPMIRDIVDITKEYKNIKILWASTRELLNINHATLSGCHIITVTPDMIKKMSNLNKDLTVFSKETVKMFFDDAYKSGYVIN